MKFDKWFEKKQGEIILDDYFLENMKGGEVE